MKERAEKAERRRARQTKSGNRNQKLDEVETRVQKKIVNTNVVLLTLGGGGIRVNVFVKRQMTLVPAVQEKTGHQNKGKSCQDRLLGRYIYT